MTTNWKRSFQADPLLEDTETRPLQIMHETTLTGLYASRVSIRSASNRMGLAD